MTTGGSWKGTGLCACVLAWSLCGGVLRLLVGVGILGLGLLMDWRGYCCRVFFCIVLVSIVVVFVVVIVGVFNVVVVEVFFVET